MRPSCDIALDLRHPGRAAAVAVDRRGKIRAWTVVDGDDEPARLGRRAVHKLRVKPRSLRVLLGSAAAQIAFLSTAVPPDAEEIGEALLAEGWDAIARPALASVAVAPGTWMVAACAEERLRLLAQRLTELVAIEPIFVVDQLLLARQLTANRGTAIAEMGENELLVYALPASGGPLARALPAADPTVAAVELRRTLDAAGNVEVRLLGSRRDELRACLGEEERLLDEPTVADDTAADDTALPDGLELAHGLARDNDIESLALIGRGLAAHHRSWTWARRLAWAGLALACLGSSMLAWGFLSWQAGRSRGSDLRAEAARVGEVVTQLGEMAAMIEEVQKLRSELARQALPWPPLAATLSELARTCPGTVGWERLELTDGALELEAVAFGAAPRRDLEGLRHALERAPGLLNLSWDEPVSEDARRGVRQIFRVGLLAGVTP